MRYAENTAVSCECSKAEIEKTIRRYGATGFQSGWEGNRAGIMFRANNKMIKFILPLPDLKSDEFSKTGCRREGSHQGQYSHSPACFSPRSESDALRLWEQACRQRWRALALSIKAKLEAVECGITTFEEEFMAHIVVPGTNGQTMAQFALKDLEKAYDTNKVPQLGWNG